MLCRCCLLFAALQVFAGLLVWAQTQDVYRQRIQSWVHRALDDIAANQMAAEAESHRRLALEHVRLDAILHTIASLEIHGGDPVTRASAARRTAEAQLAFLEERSRLLDQAIATAAAEEAAQPKPPAPKPWKKGYAGIFCDWAAGSWLSMALLASGGLTMLSMRLLPRADPHP